MNKFIAIGRIATEIRLQQNENGVIYTRFPLAVWRGKNKDGEDRGTDFPLITVFGSQAENLQKYSGKGKRITIIAHITTNRYTKNDEKRHSTSIIADRIEYIDWKDYDNTVQEDTLSDADDYYEERTLFDEYGYDGEDML